MHCFNMSQGGKDPKYFSKNDCSNSLRKKKNNNKIPKWS